MADGARMSADVAAILARALAEVPWSDVVSAHLFGSQARGRAHRESDVDVGVLLRWDLAEIGQQCAAVDASLDPVCRRAERLTPFAWIFRYPLPRSGGAPVRWTA